MLIGVPKKIKAEKVVSDLFQTRCVSWSPADVR